MNKTLIIHHLEARWETFYPTYSPHGWKFYDFSEAIARHINKKKYDQVILTQSEYSDLFNHVEYTPLFDKVTAQFEYGYGWNMEDAIFDEDRSVEGAYAQLEEIGYVIGSDGTLWAKGGGHSEIVLVDEWMQTLPKENVYICGAFHNSCIEDLEKALSHLEIKYNRIEELII